MHGTRSCNMLTAIVQSGTAGQYAERRRTIRQTWLQGRHSWEHRVVCRFALAHVPLAYRFNHAFSHAHATELSSLSPTEGELPDAMSQVQLEAEMLAHSDLVFVPLPDSMEGLAERTLLLLAYALDTFAADYFVKVDDDIYVQLPQLQLAAQEWHSAAIGAQTTLHDWCSLALGSHALSELFAGAWHMTIQHAAA
jgi:hypothetical protein